MTPKRETLYHIFENHLYNTLVEDESKSEFVAAVVRDYLNSLKASGSHVAKEHLLEIEEELSELVIEMLRKKTYGHYSLADFRRSQTQKPQRKARES